MKNGVMMQYFEWFIADDGKTLANFWKKMQAYLSESGSNSVWFPPCFKAKVNRLLAMVFMICMTLRQNFKQKGVIFETKYETKKNYS